ncbi:C-type lectin domain family 4 member E-like isoform X5 [Gambusia affinis]|uniref:C-type lectin domain family 4 member E-like isoform X5 n=1 Tax=Gambusia affinis TaxID=33528 RepID=UPI001CDD4CC8|nr:C-type lectin domain family 4 member E-like isoform X5 [Gambusia affinis]
MRFTKSVPRVNAALVDDNIYDDVMVSKQQDKVSSLADNNSAEDQLSKQKAVFYLMKNERCQTLKEDLESLKMMALDETCPKCEAGWERYRESCYFFSTNKSSWTDSRRSCTDLGSDLVKIDSREEQMFLEIRLKETIENNETFWIGLTDSKTEGSWLWPDSSPLNTSLSFWAPGQPDALGGAEVDCVCMMKTENPDEVRWFDGRCDDDLRSVCEKDSKIQLRFCV